MNPSTLEVLTEQLELADALQTGRDRMLEPQDLPGRYGRVVRAVDHLLGVLGCESVLAGGWAVWRHGYVGRVTQDVDIVLPADRIDEFLQAASVSGFEIPPQPAGRWPKVHHKQTDVTVDVLPEGGRPGSSSHPAPTTIPHPIVLGADVGILRYIHLRGLIEVKLGAGRGRDESDVIELERANMERADAIRQHLESVHSDYVAAFDRLVDRAREQEDM
ncbi:MAG: hypothetical protein ACREIV_09530 [Planctomycetaceae bacterium]